MAWSPYGIPADMLCIMVPLLRKREFLFFSLSLSLPFLCDVFFVFVCFFLFTHTPQKEKKEKKRKERKSANTLSTTERERLSRRATMMASSSSSFSSSSSGRRTPLLPLRRRRRRRTSFGGGGGDAKKSALSCRFGGDEGDGSEREEEKSDEKEKLTTTTTTTETTKKREKETKKKKKSVCIVGGTGRIGSILTGKILNDPEKRYEKVHVLTRNLSSEKVKMLKAMAEEGNDERRLTFAECDVANDTAERLKENVRGYEEVIACFGAQRVSKPFDWITNAENVDERHPKSVNFWGVRKLALAAKEGGCERFVRVTGMSVGYSAFDFIAVLLNNVLSMTIKFQLLGELAIREACTDEGMSYTIVRPGNLRDWEGIDNNSSSSSGSGSTSTSTSSSGSGSNTNSEKVVVLTHGTNHIDASKVSREDVAQVIYLALQNREATENVTLSIAGANKATAGTRSAFRWDPARGAYWETQAIDDANVQILSKWTEADFSKFQPDEKNDL